MSTSKKNREASKLSTIAFTSPVEKILQCVWNTPGVARDDGKPASGLPVLFKSDPGVGKSSRIRAAARQGGFHLETVIASLREPTDFIGLPVPAPGGTMNYVPASWAARAEEAAHAVVFFDEVNAAPQSVQMALLRVILEGVVGDLELPNTVRFVAAMNGSESCAGRWDLDPAMANRFLHLDWPSLQSRAWSMWLMGATGGEVVEPVDPADEFTRLTKGWESEWAKARGFVAAFMERKPDLLLAMPQSGDPAASGAWPSPRSWELGARALAGAALHGLPENDAEALLAGAVGAPAAKEFSDWRAAADLPDPVALLDGKVKFAHDDNRPDRTMATLSACAALVLNAACDRRPQRGEKLMQVMVETMKSAADMVVLSGMALMESKQHRGVFMAQPSFTPLWSKFEPFTRAAGITVGAK